MNTGKENQELLAVITIRGRKGDPEANVSIDFAPGMHDRSVWEDSGAAEAVMICMEALQNGAVESELVPHGVQ